MGGLGIVIGLSTYGYRVISTVGEKITQLTPSRGIAANTAATIVVLACSRMGLPVSTTHVSSGAIIGVGLEGPKKNLRWRVVAEMVSAWVVTLPLTAAVAAGFYLLLR